MGRVCMMRMGQRRLSDLLYWVYTCAAFLLFYFSFLQIPLVFSSSDEGNALYELKKSLTDRKNVLQSWDPTLPHPCTWFHVTCNSNNNVTSIDLGGSSLAGSLPTSNLGANLRNLEIIYLYTNGLTGSIPQSFGNFPKLKDLNLSGNQLSGTIPDSLGGLTNLEKLDLSNNRLEGNIPISLSSRGDSLTFHYENNLHLVVVPSPSPDISGSVYLSFGWTVITASLSLVWVMANTLLFQ